MRVHFYLSLDKIIHTAEMSVFGGGAGREWGGGG